MGRNQIQKRVSQSFAVTLYWPYLLVTESPTINIYIKISQLQFLLTLRRISNVHPSERATQPLQRYIFVPWNNLHDHLQGCYPIHELCNKLIILAIFGVWF